VLVAVPDDEALRFACNAVVLNSGCPQTSAELQRLGFRCVETPTEKLLKAGGSAKCLVLMLDTFG